MDERSNGKTEELKAEGACAFPRWVMADLEFLFASAGMESRAWPLFYQWPCARRGSLRGGPYHLPLAPGFVTLSLHLEFADFVGAMEGTWKELREGLTYMLGTTLLIKKGKEKGETEDGAGVLYTP